MKRTHYTIIGWAVVAILSGLVFCINKTNGKPKNSLTITLPETGQIESYADFDDGYYHSGPKLSFRDNGDGTVTDLNTDLMWVSSGYADTNVEPPVLYQSEGPWRRYFWNQALLYCERLNLGGYSDWRLPNYKELISIVDLSRMEPCVNQEYFLGTRADFYWTSTSFSYLTSQAWYIYFNLGYVNHINKNNYFYVRPVRNCCSSPKSK